MDAPTNSRQRRTLHRVFARPTPNDIPWPDIVSLFKHLGFAVEYGMGSRVRFKNGPEEFFCHRPHPSRQTPPEVIRDIRDFLAETGVEP